MDKRMIMSVTVSQLTRARNLAELIQNYEDLIAYYSSKPETAVAYVSFDHVGDHGLMTDVQISRDTIIDMLGAQCDKHILELESLGFRVDDV